MGALGLLPIRRAAPVLVTLIGRNIEDFGRAPTCTNGAA
jgi:hypothetical protein